MYRSDVFCMDCLEAMRKMKDNEKFAKEADEAK